MNKVKGISSSILLLVSLTACVDFSLPEPDKVLTIQIAQNKGRCSDTGNDRGCYLFKYSDTDVWQTFGSLGIRYFIYTPGNRYTIRVNKHQTVGAPAFRYEYTWLETLKSIPDSTVAVAGQP